MALKAKIKVVSKETDMETGNNYLSVSFDILAEEEVIAERKIAMPVETTKEELTAELLKYVATHEADLGQVEATKQVEAENAHVEELKEMEGQTV